MGQNVKYDMLVCRTSGIEVGEPLFDTMVAAYLASPGRREYNLDALALDYFSFKKIPTSSILGEKKNERTMDQAPVAQVAEYAVEDAVITWRLKERLEAELRERGLEALSRDVEMPLVPVLASMEELGVAVDTAVLSDIAANLEGRLAKLQAEIYAAAGHEFLINSPQQLATVLFEELGLRPGRRTATGSRPSTDADVLEELAARHPLPRLVLEFRQLAKLKGTYVDALPQLVDPHTGRIHTSFNQAITATGRLSSSDPNLQNIPIRTEEGRQVRRAFVPGQAGWLLLAADYSQIELRMLAHYTGDPALVRAFAEDRDIHTFVAHQIFGVPEGEVTEEQRRRAKVVNFSLIYGKTAYGLSRDLAISLDEAEAFIDEYFERYSGVRDFTRRVLEDAKRQGFVTTILGRRREIGEIGAMDPKRLTFAERTAINTVIQGSAADLIKVAMNRIWRRARREGRPSRLLIQIHDELIFETPDGRDRRGKGLDHRRDGRRDGPAGAPEGPRGGRQELDGSRVTELRIEDCGLRIEKQKEATARVAFVVNPQSAIRNPQPRGHQMTASGKKSPPVIGLLGGIAAGKSLVAAQFAKLGCAVVDADRLGHELLRQPAIRQAVVERFGQGILDAAGQVNRRHVAERVFADPADLAALEAILAPHLWPEVDQALEAARRTDVPAVVLDAAVLLEKGLDKRCDALVYIEAPLEVRRSRAREARGWVPSESARREAVQISLKVKRDQADYTIDNGTSTEHAFEQVQRILAQLTK